MRKSILLTCSLLGISGVLPAQEGEPAPKEPPKVAILDLKCEVEGTTMIVRLAREGAWVAKGQVIADLDSSALRDQLIHQKLRVSRAQTEREQAKKALPDAELALKEYVQLTYPTTFKGLEADLAFAEDEISLLTDELDAAEKSTTATALQRRRARFDLSKAKLAAEEIRGKLQILQTFSKITQEVSRKADIEKARSQVLATEQAYELERAQEEKLRQQIEKCSIRSPIDGVLIHPNPTGTPDGDSSIEEGAKVREGQLLLRVVQVHFE